MKRAAVDYLVKRCEAELKRLSEAAPHGNIKNLFKQRDELKAKAARLADIIENGGDDLPTLGRLNAEIARKQQQAVPTSDLRDRVLKRVLQLREMMTDEDVVRAGTALMKHVGNWS